MQRQTHAGLLGDRYDALEEVAEVVPQRRVVQPVEALDGRPGQPGVVEAGTIAPPRPRIASSVRTHPTTALQL
jgi:hypothetical protein